jgi:hypothetical protein
MTYTFFSSKSFKYGILILFVSIFVSSFICSMLVRRRAARIMLWYMPEEFERVQQSRKIPKVPPKMSEVYLEKGMQGFTNSTVSDYSSFDSHLF